MFLLDALRCILCCGHVDQEQDFYNYRNNWDYSSLNSTIPRSRSSRENHLYRDESWPLLPPASSIVDSRGNLNLRDVISSNGDGNRAIFDNFPSPSLSSSVDVYSTAASLSSKPSFAAVSSTNNNSSVVGHSTSPEKIHIKKNSATCSPVKPHTTSQLWKFPSSPIYSSTTPAPLSRKPSFAAVWSTDNNASGAELSIDPEKFKFQTLKDSATASQLSKVISPSISSPAAPAPSSEKPPLASVSSTIKKNSAVGTPNLQKGPKVSTLLSKCGSLYCSSSAKDSVSPAVQSQASPSNKPSLASLSSTNSSISEDPVRVWRVKSLITPDFTTKLAERPSSSSPSLPSPGKDAFSPVLQSIPPPVHFSTANDFVYCQKKKQTSMVQVLPASSSKASSPSSYLESGISCRRVLPKYEIPQYLEEMIKNDVVPPVIGYPLSSSNYGDIFATLLYAEDFYVEKWNDYLLKGITLELRSKNSSTNSKKMMRKSTKKMMRKSKTTMLVERDFVAFNIDSVPEKRPYILSRDFVFLKPVNEIAEPFKGRVYRVIKSTTILVEFEEDFHSQHSPSKIYDASFSFNRVCLKRAHHAISVASDPSFRSILFPDRSVSFQSSTFHLQDTANQFEDHVKRILNHKGPIPYLVNGQLLKKCPYDQDLSFTGRIINEAMLSIYRTNTRCRILVCSPTNITSDLLLRSLRKEIPVSSLFRANAAYRDYDLVPDDIFPASLYEEEAECFACPPHAQLLNFSIITCTFMSSFRLYAARINSKHFTHIFLVDASLATEPEAIVPLAHLADNNTAIVVTGCSDTSPSWVRSDIARKHGLKKSYFHRLLDREPYKSNDSMFIANLA